MLAGPLEVVTLLDRSCHLGFRAYYQKVILKKESSCVDAMVLEEKAWITSDYRFATITNGFFTKSKFSFVLESKFVNHDRVGIKVSN